MSGRGLGRVMLWVAAVAAVILVGAAMLMNQSGPSAGLGGSTGTALVGGAFTLTDQDGKLVTDASFRGKAMVVFFGFSHCPEICPTTLAELGRALDQLGGEADRLTPLFITIDPERDSPAVLKDYLAGFHARLVGLTGTPDQIKAVARAYRAYYAKESGKDPAAPASYDMNHSTVVYLMGSDGGYVGHLAAGATAEEMVEKLRALLAAG